MKQAQKGNWQILGAGSQGLLWAAALTRAGAPVTLLRRDVATTPEPIQYESADGSATYSVAAQSVATAAPHANVLVTVKATDLEMALTRLAAHTPRLVVLLQNGIGAEAIARQCLPDRTVIWLGSSTHGSFRKARNHVVHAGRGAIWLGPGRGSLAATEHNHCLAQLQQSGLDVQWDEHILARLWRKLAINSCINPLTALLNCRNGALLQLPLARHWLPALATEAAAVLQAEGLPLSAAELLTEVEQIAKATAANYNSMQQDYQQQRPTEIRFITGALLAAAARHGVPARHHAELLQRVEQRQSFGV